MRFDLGVIDLGAVETVLAHQIGRGEPGVEIAEFMVDLALDIAGLVVVQQHGVRRAGGFRIVVGRQLAQLEFDQIDRALRRFGVDRRHRGDRLAAIAHPAARQRIFVHGDRQHAVGDRAILAGDHRDDAVERERLADVDADNVAVADRTAQDAADQSPGYGRGRRCSAPGR